MSEGQFYQVLLFELNAIKKVQKLSCSALSSSSRTERLRRAVVPAIDN